MERIIEKEQFGDMKNGMLAIVQCATSKPDFFARRLYKAMKVLSYGCVGF